MNYLLGPFLLILAGLFWAIDTLIRYPLLEKISAPTIVFFEHIILLILFSPKIVHVLCSKRANKVIYKNNLFNFFMVGGVGSGLATLAFTKAMSIINPSIVIVLQKLQPVIAITLAVILLGEKLSKKFFLSTLLCFVGGMLLSHKDFEVLLQDSNQNSHFLGYILALLAVIGWGSATVYSKKLINAGLSESEILSGRFLMGFIAVLPFFLLEKVNIILLGPMIFIQILIMVLLSGLCAMYFYYKGLRYISAKLCAILEMFFPLSAIVINYLILDIVMTPIQILGTCCLILGSATIQINEY